MFGLVFVSDGQNEDPLVMALILIAQLALLLCEIISVCYTCTCTCMWVEKRENALVQADVPLYNTCSLQIINNDIMMCWAWHLSTSWHCTHCTMQQVYDGYTNSSCLSRDREVLRTQRLGYYCCYNQGVVQYYHYDSLVSTCNLQGPLPDQQCMLITSILHVPSTWSSFARKSSVLHHFNCVE